MNEIVVIGSTNVDLIMKLDRLPERGETVADGELSRVHGGKGANQAVAAALSGGDVAFISCVGNDPNAKPMVDSFKLANINTEFVFRENDLPSGTALIMVGKGGDNYISVSPGANYKLSPEYIDTAEELIKHANFVLIQSEIPPETLAYAIKKSKEFDAQVIWNSAPARNVDLSILHMTDILVANEIEAALLAKKEIKSDTDIKKAAEYLLSHGVRTVIITLGPAGSYVATRERQFRVPSFDVKQVDATSAGDTYCGCLATALSQGKSIEEAVNFASAAAALSVTRLGAQPSAPSRKEILDFLNSGS